MANAILNFHFDYLHTSLNASLAETLWLTRWSVFISAPEQTGDRVKKSPCTCVEKSHPVPQWTKNHPVPLWTMRNLCVVQEGMVRKETESGRNSGDLTFEENVGQHKLEEYKYTNTITITNTNFQTR